MNRKERRAAEKRLDESARKPNALARSAGLGIADLAAEASRLRGMGRLDDAQAICRQILAREPAHVPALNLLGLMAQATGDHRGAVKAFAKAIAADEVNAACHYNAGNSYQALGSRTKAIAHFGKALALGMEEKAVPFILQSPTISAYIRRIAGKWPLPVTGAELFGTEGVTPLAKDLFLCAAMEATVLPSVQLEGLLGYARAELLRLAGEQREDAGDIDDDIVAFACALARQCFVNEYIYVQSESESGLASVLRDRLAQNLASEEAITPFILAVIAAYFPLHAVPMAEALRRRGWPAAVDGLLRVQLREPLEEAEDKAAISKLVPIKDGVSLEVMRQYEENPYPRWTINPLNAFVADEARGRTTATAERQAEQDILIAGCGTGMHAIEVAQVYPNARLLAIDISLTSLAYARRKTRELGLRNIEYAQADILELGTIGRTFDRIESVGVLHHLAEPVAGWRVLVSMLRPAGRMRIGLYSDLARRMITEARARIASRGYRATADDIRRFRQDVIREPEMWKALMESNDFYSMSGCRDLLFNVMEHCFTIPQIAAFLGENGLSFLGFAPAEDPELIRKFHQQFAGAADELNLDQWHRFETDHPETFRGMYVFTVGRNAQ
jgi:2-polyprenyl-3-methyl-5-hydroxy-6-metoxy-1,4-benzoquinol methylase/tetratricopeptide (TPR) repeat protein